MQRKASPLGEKIGTGLAFSQLNVTDDGLIGGGMMTKTFDDEDSPRKRTPILEKENRNPQGNSCFREQSRVPSKTSGSPAECCFPSFGVPARLL
jgi:hypothetical protein